MSLPPFKVCPSCMMAVAASGTVCSNCLHAFPARVKRPGYREAITWMALNDDTEWVTEFAEVEEPASVTACMVADLFGVTQERVTEDLRRALKKRDRK